MEYWFVVCKIKHNFLSLINTSEYFFYTDIVSIRKDEW